MAYVYLLSQQMLVYKALIALREGANSLSFHVFFSFFGKHVIIHWRSDNGSFPPSMLSFNALKTKDFKYLQNIL